MQIIAAIIARLSTALPTEEELAESLTEGLAWWDNLLDKE